MDEYTLFWLESYLPDRNLDIYDPKTDAVLTHKISDYAGKFLVLFFYPADFTFVCPTELKDLYSKYSELKDLDAEVLVVSVDTVFTHKRRIETEGLLEGFGIKMVSDRKGELSMSLGIMNENSGNSERGTFIVDPDGVIKSIEVVTEPIGRSSVELVRKVAALQYVRNHPGQACPANRNTTMKTLKPGIKIAGKVDQELK